MLSSWFGSHFSRPGDNHTSTGILFGGESVLIGYGCQNEAPQTVWFIPKLYCLTVLGVQMSKVSEASVWLVSSHVFYPGL